MLFHYCICGKVCTSKVGFILHERKCSQAQEAILKGESTEKSTNSLVILEDWRSYPEEVKELLLLVHKLSLDASKAIKEGNKSAGRRARSSLMTVKKLIPFLRKKILKEFNKDRRDA